MTAVHFACNQLGKPYAWGGNGPGFDCSGLSATAYAAAKITLPRTAQTQYNADPKLPAGTAPQPGDLIFFGTPNNIQHVGISLGGNLMIHAPYKNQAIRVQDYHQLADLAGITRPTG